MDLYFRAHIVSTARPLVDAGAPTLSDREIARVRGRGELLLNCVADPADYYHFTVVGWVVVK